MAFKECNEKFDTKDSFLSSTVKFISEEAAFMSDEEERGDLGSGAENALELVVVKSASDENKKVKAVDEELRQFNRNNPMSEKDIRKELKILKKEDVTLRERELKLHSEQAQFQQRIVSGNISKEEAKEIKEKLLGEERFCNGERDRIEERKSELNETKSKKKDLEKEKKEAKKKAAGKTSLANALKRGKGVKKDFEGSTESSGNAFTDGSSGTVGMILDVINPLTYLKHLGMTIAVALVPYIILIMGIVVVIMTIVAILGMALS